MDSLKESIANLSLYDVKAYVRKAQNVVMNYTEMEAKVREATNNEPWGASSTLMQEIADGTNSYSHFHEIMPMIYKRFTEKSAEEWRQIYKALQLLEFLIKNGSERVVDYARSHSGVIEMLKHFHYIDGNGKDQGVNIRNRAKELLNLLKDVDKIRTERKKARGNKAKYGGIGNEESGGFGGSGKKYGGFGSDSLEFGGGHANKVFGDGGGFNGSNYDGPGYSFGNGSDEEFEEYEVGTSPSANAGWAASSRAESSKVESSKPPAQKAPAPQDIISFDEPANGDDDFDDFQSAAPEPVSKPKLDTNSLAGLFASPSPSPSPALPMTTGSSTNSAFRPSVGMASPSAAAAPPAKTEAPAKKDAFGDLWSNASANKSKKKLQSQGGSMASLAQQKAQQTMWGQSSNQDSKASGNDDLLLF